MDVQTEIVIDANGLPRQAGSSQQEGEFIGKVKLNAERSLYFFVKAILGRSYLNKKLHREVCSFLTTTPPYRKLLLLPREHCKTSVVSHGIPAHAVIQPKEHDIYKPGTAGVDLRILLAGETLDRASKNLSTIQTGIFENNKLFRALWPHVVWEARPAKRWNANEMVVPRNVDYPDPTIQALGVDGAVTGGRFDIVVKDDLISLKAANSSAEMETAFHWHRSSRALFESDTTLEFIIGTHWAVFDLYSFIKDGGMLGGEWFDKDYTVQVMIRAMVEDGQVIYPEKFSLKPEPGKQDVETLKKQFNVLFWLNYMNSAANPDLTDFSAEDLRYFSIDGDLLTFDDAETEFNDDVIEESKPVVVDDGLRGRRLDNDMYDLMKARKEYLRVRG